MAGFPTQIILLSDDEGAVRNLIYMATTGDVWVREGNEWVDFIVDETDPRRQLEDLIMTSVDPRFIDLFDSKDGEVEMSDASDYKYTYIPNPNYMLTAPDEEDLEG